MGDSKADSNSPPEDHFEPLKVLETWDETPSLHAVRVALGAHGTAHRTPGQVVKVRAPSGVGYFALASAPSAEGHADLLLKRGGAVADEVIAAADAARSIDATAPFGRGFPVEPAAGRDVLLFAVGSGIAPVRALVQHFLSAGEARRVALFYGQRDAGDFAFTKEHEAWTRAGLVLHLCGSRAADGFTGSRGYVQDVAREVAFGGIAPANAVAYLSGLKEMVAGVREVLLAAGVAPERIFLNF